MCVSVNWIHAALKVTVCYIPAADCVFNIIKQQNTKSLCSSQKIFSFNKKQSKFNSTVRTMLFYFTFDYSISIAVN